MLTRFADIDDIPLLVTLRLDFFAAQPALMLSDAQKSPVQEQLYQYYSKHLDHDFFAALADDNGKNAAVSFLVIQEKPANINFPTGKSGLILNVFTYPPYRRLGYATETLKLLIEKAKKEGASRLELSATESGRYVYEKLGFKAKAPGGHTEMILNL